MQSLCKALINEGTIFAVYLFLKKIGLLCSSQANFAESTTFCKPYLNAGISAPLV